MSPRGCRRQHLSRGYRPPPEDPASGLLDRYAADFETLLSGTAGEGGEQRFDTRLESGRRYPAVHIPLELDRKKNFPGRRPSRVYDPYAAWGQQQVVSNKNRTTGSLVS